MKLKSLRRTAGVLAALAAACLGTAQPATAQDARWTLQYYLDAQKQGISLGKGYLDPYVLNAAITKVEAPDAATLVVTTSRPNDRILQMYLPILPEHVWKDVKPDKAGDFDHLHAGLTSRGQRCVAVRSHAKVQCFASDDGRRFVVETSANLRSCRNAEQLTLIADAGLHDFHAAWIDQLLRRAG